MKIARMDEVLACLLSGLAFPALVKGQRVQQFRKERPRTPAPTPSPTRGSLPVLEAYYTHHVFQDSKRTTCATYSMSEYGQNYETSDIDSSYMKWGLHALQWKGYNHISAGGTFDAWLANSLGPPSGNWPDSVKCVHKDALNTLEQSNIYDVDPIGTWMCVSEPDAHAGAVTAAMNMHYWKTPTYLDARGYLTDDIIGTFSIVGAVIEKVTLCAAGASPPHVVCNWDTIDWTTNLGTITPCAASLALDSVEVGAFVDIITGGTGQTYFHSHNVVDGADWANHYGDWAQSNNWDLVFDPPVGTSDETIARIQKVARETTNSLIGVKKEYAYVESGNVRMEKRGKLFNP